MIRRNTSLIGTLVILAIFLSSAIGPAAAQTPQPGDAQPPARGDHPVLPDPNIRLEPGQHLVPTGDGKFARVMEASADNMQSSISTTSLGGPDGYGYSWNNSTPFTWFDATIGVHTGLSNGSWGNPQVTNAVNLGFNFNFYGNTYSQIYISTSGAVGFDRNSLLYPTELGSIPSPDNPNNVIAPYMGTFFMNTGSYTGKVYYLTGGVPGSRYFVAEWSGVKDDLGGTFTFETILYENGNIDFSYANMVHGNNTYYCGWGAAIENAAGDDGLVYIDPIYCTNMSYQTGKTARFTHPPLMARVGISDLNLGALTGPNQDNRFEVTIKNTGDLGADTYELTAGPDWPVFSLYAADGTTVLTDTNGNLTVDTGQLAAGASTKVVVSILAPSLVLLGNNYIAYLTVMSTRDNGKQKTVNMKLAVPAPFAQIYQDDEDAGLLRLDLIKTNGQAKRSFGIQYDWANDPAILELPNGNFFISYEKTSCGASTCSSSIKYGLVDRTGKEIRPVSFLTQNSDPTNYIYDTNPAAAVTPDGKIGLVWAHQVWISSNNTQNLNLYFAELNLAGGLVYGPVNLTNNNKFGAYNTLNVPYYYDPSIAATGDNRFVLAWEQYSRLGSDFANGLDDIYYTVRNSDGSQRRAITKLTSDVNGSTDGFWKPVSAKLVNNRVLLAWASNNNGIQYGVLDSNGTLIWGVAACGCYGNPDDAAQLSNNNILLTLTAWSDVAEIQYVMLAPLYTKLMGPSTLGLNAAHNGSSYSSIVVDSTGYAIITWQDYLSSFRRKLYYALLDQNGSVITPPQVMRTAQTPDWGSPYIATSFQGQGSTSYSWQTSATQDVWLTSNSLFGAAPGGIAQVPVRMGNWGEQSAQGVALTATLGSGVSYVGDNSGITPVINLNTVTWNLPDNNFLDSGGFTLQVSIPSDAIGTLHSLDLTITAAGSDGNPANNQVAAQVMTSLQLFLPKIAR